MNTQTVATIIANLQSLVGEKAFAEALASASISAPSSAMPIVAAKKPSKKAAAAEQSEEKVARAPSAWNAHVSQSISEMRTNGWDSWTDKKGEFWPASRAEVVFDSKGKKISDFVYDGGAHDGKPPSPALGGMAYASHMKAIHSPSSDAASVASGGASAEAPKKAKKAKKAVDTSDAASVAGSIASGGASGSEAAAKKKGRPKMTEEQKAEAATKRAAKKAQEIDHGVGVPAAWAALANETGPIGF